jgi:hypothetical protein
MDRPATWIVFLNTAFGLNTMALEWEWELASEPELVSASGRATSLHGTSSPDRQHYPHRHLRPRLLPWHSKPTTETLAQSRIGGQGVDYLRVTL